MSRQKLQQGYIAVYNASLAVSWAYTAVLVLLNCARQQQWQAGQDAWALAGVLQMVSALETVHAASGLVKSDVASNVMQWCARSHALFCVVLPEDALWTCAWGATMLMAWSVGESCRYPKCATTCNHVQS